MDFLWNIALIALGVFMLLKPELVAKLDQLLMFRKEEPFRGYRKWILAGGVFFILAGAVSLVRGFLG